MSGQTEVCGDGAKPGLATRSRRKPDLVRMPAQAGWHSTWGIRGVGSRLAS